MKRYLSILLFFALITLIFASSCKDDIVLEPLPTLEGTYLGEYLVIDNYRAPDSVVSRSTIEMLFSEESYFFNSDNDPDPFCDPRGNYVLAANTIELDESQRNCSGVIASEVDNPRGTFSIRRPADSVILVQIDSTTLKRISLQKQ